MIMNFLHKLNINTIMNRIITIITFVAIAANLSAQPRDHMDDERWERFRSEKVAFLSTTLDLTPAEAEKFWPVYNQLEKERWEIHKLRRQVEEKVQEAEENMSDQRIKQLTREFAGSMKKEADMVTSYNEKLLEILPPKKVLKLYKAENEFRMHMIKKFRDKRRSDN
jgi:hypothetical protein